MYKFFAAVLLIFALLLASCYDSSLLTPNEVRHELDYKKISFVVLDNDGSTGRYKTAKGLCFINNDTLYGQVSKIIDEHMAPRSNVKIPTSKIKYFEVEDFNTTKTIVMTGVLLGGTALLISSLSSNESNSSSSYSPASGQRFSCPLIYTFGNSGYKLESETFAGAVFKGIERTAYDVLYHLKNMNGIYKIKLVNAREETEYVNSLKLLVVDHLADKSVIPDYYGKIHTISDRIRPLKACDKSGQNVINIVNAKDDQYWESDLKYININNDYDLIDKLTLSFPKPKNVQTVKIIVTGLNTELAYFALEKVFSLQGNERINWYNKLDSNPKERSKFLGWLMREGMLHLSVWNGKEWSERGIIPDVGPGVEKTQITILNISDICDDVLKLKVSFRAGLWKINQIFVDYSSDSPINIQELSTFSAVNDRNEDVSNLISASDSSYYVTINGEFAKISFLAPPSEEGFARTLIAKTQGFYNQWGLKSDNFQPEVVDRILTEPLYSSRYLIPLWSKEQAEQKVNSFSTSENQENLTKILQ